MKIKSVWILTREENQYDQFGEYFVAVFFEKPTVDQIMKEADCDEVYAKHILNGGGRTQRYENTWYFLKEFNYQRTDKPDAQGEKVGE